MFTTAYRLETIITADNQASQAIRSFRDDIAEASAALDRLERTVSAKVDLDTTPLDQKLKEAETRLDAFGSKSGTAKADVDTSQVTEKVDAAGAKVDSFGQKKAEAKADVSTDAGLAKLENIEGKLSGFGRMVEEARAMVGTEQGTAAIETIEARLQKFGGQVETAKADISTAEGIAKLDTMRAQLGDFSHQVYAARLDLDIAAAEAKAVGFRALVGQLLNFHPTVTVDVDTAGATAKLISFRGIATVAQGSLQSLSAAVFGAAQAWPVLAVAIGAAVALMAPIAATVVALTGGLAVLGTAVAGVGVGFGLLAAGIIPLAKAISDASDSTKSLTTANTQLEKAQMDADKAMAKHGADSAEYALALQKVEAAQQKVNDRSSQGTDAVGRLIASWDSLKGVFQDTIGTNSALADSLADTGSKLLDMAGSALPRLAVVAVNTEKSVSGAIDGIIASFSNSSITQNAVSTFLEAVPGMTATAVTAIGTFGQALVNIFGQATPAAQELLSYIANLAQRFLDWTQSTEGIKAIQTAIDGIREVAPAVAEAIGRIASAFGNVKPQDFKDAADTIRGIGEVIGQVIERAIQISHVFTGIVGAIKAVGSAIPGFGTAFKAAIDPIGTAIKVVSAGISGISSAFSGIGGAASSASSAVVSAFTSLPGRIGSILSSIGSGATSAFNGLRSAASSVVSAVVGFFQALPGRIASIISGIGSGAASAFGALRSAASSVVSAIVGFFQSLPGRILGLLSQLGSGFTSVVRGLATAAGTVVGQIVNFFTQLPGRLASIWESIVSAAQSAWQSIVSFVQNIPSMIASVWETIKQAASDTWTAIKSAAQTAWDAIVSFIQNVPSMVASVWESLKSAASATWEAIKAAATTAWNAIVSFIQNVPSMIASVWEAIKSAASAAWDWVLSTAQSAWNSVVSAVQNSGDTIDSVISAIESFIVSTWESIKSTVVGLANDLASGVVAAFDWLKGALASVGDWIYSNVVQPFEDAYNAVTKNSIVPDMARDVMANMTDLSTALGAHGPKIHENLVKPFRLGHQHIVDILTGHVPITIRDVHGHITPWPQRLSQSMSPIKDAMVKPFADAHNLIVGNSIVPDTVQQTGQALGQMAPTVTEAMSDLPNAMANPVATGANQVLDVLYQMLQGVRQIVTEMVYLLSSVGISSGGGNLSSALGAGGAGGAAPAGGATGETAQPSAAAASYQNINGQVTSSTSTTGGGVATVPSSGGINAETLSREQVSSLQAQGWWATPTDNHEMIYPPGSASQVPGGYTSTDDSYGTDLLPQTDTYGFAEGGVVRNPNTTLAHQMGGGQPMSGGELTRIIRQHGLSHDRGRPGMSAPNQPKAHVFSGSHREGFLPGGLHEDSAMPILEEMADWYGYKTVPFSKKISDPERAHAHVDKLPYWRESKTMGTRADKQDLKPENLRSSLMRGGAAGDAGRGRGSAFAQSPRIHVWGEGHNEEMYMREGLPKEQAVPLLQHMATKYHRVLVPHSMRSGDLGGKEGGSAPAGARRQGRGHGTGMSQPDSMIHGFQGGAEAEAWLESLVGMPYHYMEAGPDGYDCAGLWTSIIDVYYQGAASYNKWAATNDFAAGLYGYPGTGGELNIGVNLSGEGGMDDSHMAGDIIGTPGESTDPAGVSLTRGTSGFSQLFYFEPPGSGYEAAGYGYQGGGMGMSSSELRRIIQSHSSSQQAPGGGAGGGKGGKGGKGGMHAMAAGGRAGGRARLDEDAEVAILEDMASWYGMRTVGYNPKFGSLENMHVKADKLPGYREARSLGAGLERDMGGGGFKALRSLLMRGGAQGDAGRGRSSSLARSPRVHFGEGDAQHMMREGLSENEAVPLLQYMANKKHRVLVPEGTRLGDLGQRSGGRPPGGSHRDSRGGKPRQKKQPASIRGFQTGGTADYETGYSSGGQQALGWAQSILGYPYSLGYAGPDYYDCAGFICSVIDVGTTGAPSYNKWASTYDFADGVWGYSGWGGEMQVGVNLYGEPGPDGTHAAATILGQPFEAIDTYDGVSQGRGADGGFYQTFYDSFGEPAAGSTDTSSGYDYSTGQYVTPGTYSPGVMPTVDQLYPSGYSYLQQAPQVAVKSLSPGTGGMAPLSSGGQTSSSFNGGVIQTGSTSNVNVQTIQPRIEINDDDSSASQAMGGGTSDEAAWAREASAEHLFIQSMVVGPQWAKNRMWQSWLQDHPRPTQQQSSSSSPSSSSQSQVQTINAPIGSGQTTQSSGTGGSSVIQQAAAAGSGAYAQAGGTSAYAPSRSSTMSAMPMGSGTAPLSGGIDATQLSRGQVSGLQSGGWYSSPTDQAEAVYPPEGGGGLMDWLYNGIVFGNVFSPTDDVINTLYQKAMEESQGDPNAYNPDGDSAGLFQIIPSTWESFRNVYGSDAGSWDPYVWDGTYNTGVATRIMNYEFGYPIASGYYAQGGVALQPHTAMVAEYNPELVMPLNDPTAARQFTDTIQALSPTRENSEHMRNTAHHTREIWSNTSILANSLGDVRTLSEPGQPGQSFVSGNIRSGAGMPGRDSEWSGWRDQVVDHLRHARDHHEHTRRNTHDTAGNTHLMVRPTQQMLRPTEQTSLATTEMFPVSQSNLAADQSTAQNTAQLVNEMGQLSQAVQSSGGGGGGSFSSGGSSSGGGGGIHVSFAPTLRASGATGGGVFVTNTGQVAHGGSVSSQGIHQSIQITGSGFTPVNSFSNTGGGGGGGGGGSFSGGGGAPSHTSVHISGSSDGVSHSNTGTGSNQQINLVRGSNSQNFSSGGGSFSSGGGSSSSHFTQHISGSNIQIGHVSGGSANHINMGGGGGSSSSAGSQKTEADQIHREIQIARQDRKAALQERKKTNKHHEALNETLRGELRQQTLEIAAAIREPVDFSDQACGSLTDTMDGRVSKGFHATENQEVLHDNLKRRHRKARLGGR